MWLPFAKNDNIYTLKHDSLKNTFYLTNFKHLWALDLKKNEIIENFKALNTLYNGDDDEIYNISLEIIVNVEIITEVVFDNDDTCVISYKTKLEGLKINYNLNLVKSSQNLFFEEITVPLLKTVQFLELKKNKYSELLEKKDNELQEYQLEFGEITRRNIITEKHVKDVETRDTNLFLNLFKQNNFSENFGGKFGDLKKDHPELLVKTVEKRKLTLPTSSKKRKL